MLEMYRLNQISFLGKQPMSDDFDNVLKITSVGKLYQEAIDNGFSEIDRIKGRDGSDILILFENKKGYKDLEDNKVFYFACMDLSSSGPSVFYSWEMSEVEDFKNGILTKER